MRLFNDDKTLNFVFYDSRLNDAKASLRKMDSNFEPSEKSDTLENAGKLLYVLS